MTPNFDPSNMAGMALAGVAIVLLLFSPLWVVTAFIFDGRRNKVPTSIGFSVAQALAAVVLFFVARMVARG